MAEIADPDVEPVVGLWRACDLTRPWNDPYRDIADARLGETSTVLVGRVAPALGPDDAAAAGDAPRPGEVVASAMVGLDGHRGWVYYLAVDPRVQGGGLGREMVVAAEAWLAAQGARKVQLMVRSANEAVVAFYARLGYADQGCTVLGRRLDDA
ncbi:GNAT family acetyltransferase [Cellulosimicrobium sp. PMB13]|uniref:GNAT family acetyltransferase n=1 Tax=Cellulosimicrobium sp. PMB13 TaxID=3120158 RepID=UPI003F4B4DBF